MDDALSVVPRMAAGWREYSGCRAEGDQGRTCARKDEIMKCPNCGTEMVKLDKTPYDWFSCPKCKTVIVSAHFVRCTACGTEMRSLGQIGASDWYTCPKCKQLMDYPVGKVNTMTVNDADYKDKIEELLGRVLDLWKDEEFEKCNAALAHLSRLVMAFVELRRNAIAIEGVLSKYEEE